MVEPVGRQGLGRGRGRRLAHQAAQHGVDQPLERPGGPALLGEIDGCGYRRMVGHVHVQELRGAQAQDAPHHFGRRLFQAGVQRELERAAPAKHGQGQGAGEGAVARVERRQRRRGHRVLQSAAAIERRLHHFQRRATGGEAGGVLGCGTGGGGFRR